MRKLKTGRNLLILLGALVVSGCALPVPVQVASWALDGISYLATQKSMTDHGISFIAQKDCALWRSVQGNNICQSYDETGDIAVAALEPADDPTEVAQGTEITEELTEFETASGDQTVPVEVVNVVVEPEPVAPVAPLAPVTMSAPIVSAQSIESAPPVIRVAPAPKPAPDLVAKSVQVASLVQDKAPQIKARADAVVAGVGQRVLIPGQRTWSDRPSANMYYVIGSFQKRNNAKRLVARLRKLGPAVMASRVNGVETYRVAIGPFTRVEQRSVKWALKKSGIRDSWAISIDRSQWMIASQKPPAAETASLPDKLTKNIIKPLESIDNKQLISENPPIHDPPVKVGSEAGQTLHFDIAAILGPGRKTRLRSGDQIGRIVNLS